MTKPAISNMERRRRLALRHRLIPSHKTDRIAGIADDLVAIHGTDPVSVYLSIASRMSKPTISSIADAIHTENEVIRHHAMRRTLWLMTPDVLVAAHRSSTLKIAQSEEKRLLKWLSASSEVKDAEAWLNQSVETVVAYVEAVGEASTKEIGNAHPELKVTLEVPGASGPATLSAHTRLLLQAGFRGELLRGRPLGSWIAAQYRWTRNGTEVFAEAAAMDTQSAATLLLERWLRRFGPGTEIDLRWWTGWTATLVRRALSALDAVEVDLETGGIGWTLPDDLDSTPHPDHWVAVLPGLDATPMGWKDRDWYLGEAEPRVFDRYGNVGPTIWADGKIVGGWAQRTDGQIATELYEPLNDRQTRLLADEIAKLRNLVGDTRFRFRFPSPNYPDLVG